MPHKAKTKEGQGLTALKAKAVQSKAKAKA